MAWRQRRGSGARRPSPASPTRIELLRVSRQLALDVPVVACRWDEVAALFADGASGHRARPCRPADPGRPRSADCRGHDRLDRPGGGGGPRRAGGGARHQPDRQERALCRRLRPSRPYRISRRSWPPSAARTPRPVMMLCGDELRVVPVTIHIPLARVPRQLTTELIVETGAHRRRRADAPLRHRRPRLAVDRPQSPCRRRRHARR